jgi:hypothetical protein
VSEDWAAVAAEINARLAELGWQQRELVERSQVSSAIVREIQRNTVSRKRSPRTLESLSLALGWHPQHLDAVLHGLEPPKSQSSSGRDLSTRMDALEERLGLIEERLIAIQANLLTVVEHVRRVRREP